MENLQIQIRRADYRKQGLQWVFATAERERGGWGEASRLYTGFRKITNNLNKWPFQLLKWKLYWCEFKSDWEGRHVRQKKPDKCFRKFSYKENRVVDRKTMTARKRFFPYFKWDGNFHVHLWLSIFPYFSGERKKCWCNLRTSTSLQPLQKSGWWGKWRNLVYKWKGLPSVRTWIIWKEIN